MSLTVDPREGSKELVAPLRARGLAVDVETLSYGDVSFIGNGPDGLTPVGVEYKKLGDLLAVIRDGRFAAHQLPGMHDSFAYSYLVIEGDYCSSQDGELLIRSGAKWKPVSWGLKKWMYREVLHWRMSMAKQGGVEILQTRNRADTVATIHALYSWWTAKEWGEHGSLKVFHTAAPPGLARPNLVAKWAKELPGIGWERAFAVARIFKTVRQMVLADKKAWLAIEGIGKTTAEKAVEVCA